MRNKVFVLPGEMAVSRQPSEIATLLGSCVAVCLYNKKIKAGGLNHYMLPTGEKEEMKGKYGDYATGKLIEMMLRLDPNIRNLEAYLYGGAAVVGHLSTGAGIGIKNIEMAETMLKKYGIRITSREVGGENGRKIFFDSESGEVEMRLIERSELTKQIDAKKRAIASRKIRVMVVDDSSTVRQIIKKALELDDGIEVVGDAEDAYEAREMLMELDPDVLTLDIIMPKMDGLTFLKKLMLHFPKPIIIVSTIASDGSKQKMRAQDMGAVDVIDKEELKLYQGLDKASSVLIKAVRSAAVMMVKKRSVEEIGHI
ncbi:MAG: response regulator [Nitrospinota bacterium]